MPDISIHAERFYATRAGWTNLVEAGGSLVGTPPAGAEDSRGQAAVPRWARDWNACGPLMVEHRLIWLINDGHVFAGLPNGRVLAATALADHPDEDAAVRHAIVMAAGALREAAAHDCLDALADAARRVS